MKPLPLVIAGLVLAVLGGALWLLFDDTEAPGLNGSAVVATGSTDELAARGGEAPRATPSELSPLAVAEPAAPAPVVEEGAMPASYRAALGGLIGRVVEESGEPVVGITLALLGGGVTTVMPPLDAVFLAEQAPAFDPVLGEATTDGEGRFGLADIDPRILGVLLLDPGGPRATLHMLEETPVTGTVRDLGDIVMPGSVVLTGQIVDQRTLPLPGVRVRATDLPEIVVGSGVADFRAGGGVLVAVEEGDEEMTFVAVPSPALARLERLLPLPTTTTDAEGRFELTGVRVGVVAVLADDGLHQTLVKGAIPTGVAGGTRDVGVLTMGDGYPLEGRVVDSGGKPVAGAEVMAGSQMAMAPVTILRPPTVTDGNGRFTVPGLRDGPARAVGRADRSGSFVASEAGAAGGAEVTIRLAADRKLVLALVDGQGEPVTGARFMGRVLPADAEEMPDFLLPPLSLDERVSVDEQGRSVLTPLTPGMWDIAIRAPGFAAQREVHDLRWQDVELRVVLEPELGIDVRVVRQGSGEPVEWALVAAREAGRSGPQPITAARTDADGTVRLSGLPPGDYGLDVTHPALAVVSVPVEVPAADTIVVELPVGGTVAGFVLDGGAPPAEPLMVTLHSEGQEAPAGEMPRLTLTLPDGSFRFTNVEPGEAELEARQRVELSNLSSWWEPFAMTPEASGTAFVESGKEVEVTLLVGSSYADMETGTVEGRLFVDGHPGADWKVRTWGQIRRTASTGPDGSFTMGRLAAGKVVLMLSPADMPMMTGGVVATHELELAVDGHEFVEISITTGRVRGRVVSADESRPLEGVVVSLTAAGEERGWGGRRQGAATQRDGRFEIDTVAEGEYVLSAELEGWARARSEPFAVRGRDTVDGLELRLTSAVPVSGRFVIEGAEGPPEWLWMTAESDTGLEAATRPEIEQGTFSFDDLSPGRWTFSLHTSHGLEFETVTEEVRHARDDLLLVFRPAPEEDEQPQVEVVDDG